MEQVKNQIYLGSDKVVSESRVESWGGLAGINKSVPVYRPFIF
jgi:hypothetical protein